MWLFTRHGFYSVATGTDKQGKPDPDVMMIRARVRRHLVALGKLTGEWAGKDVKMTDHTDYRYRVVVTNDVWDRVASALAYDVDYPNFKAAAGKKTDPGYTHALHRVWSVMFNLQLDEVEGRNQDDGPGHRPMNPY